MKHEKRIGRQRRRRRFRVRNAVKKHSTRPRLSVFRSHKHIYAQIIDDEAGKTLAAASSLDKELRQEVTYGGNTLAAGVVGRTLAARALEAGVRQAAFDRREYKYHGRIKALAHAARLAGLDLGPEPEPEEPKAGKAKAWKTKAGKAEAGKPKAGKPKAGKPKAGKPKAGKPEAGKSKKTKSKA